MDYFTKLPGDSIFNYFRSSVLISLLLPLVSVFGDFGLGILFRIFRRSGAGTSGFDYFTKLPGRSVFNAFNSSVFFFSSSSFGFGFLGSFGLVFCFEFSVD